MGNNINIKDLAKASVEMPYLSFLEFMLGNLHKWDKLSYTNIKELMKLEIKYEVSLVGRIIFFGKYLRIDLIEAIPEIEIRNKIEDYFSTRRSLFCFLDKYDFVSLDLYGVSKSYLMQLCENLIKEGAKRIVDSPPQIVEVKL